MVVVVEQVTSADIAATRELRIDPHYFWLHRQSPLRVGASARDVTVSKAEFGISNGENLGAGSYLPEGETSTFGYASVSAISQYTLAVDRLQLLRDPTEHRFDPVLESIEARDDEVLITRSGTPGVAWPASLRPAGVTVIPSGFLIRLRCDVEKWDARFVAGVFNHPAWRIWTSALAAGKRQRNLSQEHLLQVSIPMLPMDIQRALGGDYEQALASIAEILADESSLGSLCDEVISSQSGIEYPSLRLPSAHWRTVSLVNVARSRSLRIDPNYHRTAYDDVESILATIETKPLRSLIAVPIFKGTQAASTDGSGEERLVSTIAIQDGQVVFDGTKELVAAVGDFGDRQLQLGDVVVTMDGAVSIGRAAAFDGTYDAVPDSHVAVCRTGDSDLAKALACFLNSSLGQSQIKRHVSGASAPQLSKFDLEDVAVPTELLANYHAVAASYVGHLVEFRPRSERVRDRICDFAISSSQCLADHGQFEEESRDFLAGLTDRRSLRGLLDTLTPGMF